MKSLFVGTENEITYLILFDVANRLICCKKLAEGYSCGNVIYYRDVAKEVVTQNAAAALLVHNHPHGKPIPSSEDVEATGKINNMLKTLGVTFIDHFIVAKNRCVPILSYEKADLYNQ
jgi:DNA repair protein RadC